MAESEQVDDHVHFDQSYGLSRPGLGSVAEKMAAGASILIHGIEFHLPELWSIVADLETVGGRSSSASVIVFGPRSAYVETSERTNDVLLAAIDAEFLLEAGSSQSTVIEPGSGIVVPAGHATTVTPLVTPERSEVLLRFDLPAADPWFDLVNAASAARFHPLLRADLPTLIDAPIESYAGSLCQADQWRAEVASVFTAQAFNHVAAYERACIAPRPDLQRGLLTALTGTNPHEGLVRSPSNGGVMLAEYEGDWRLVIDGMILEPPGGGGVAMAVAEHLDGRPFDVTVLLDCLAGSGLGEFVIDRLVADLIRLELIEVLG